MPHMRCHLETVQNPTSLSLNEISCCRDRLIGLLTERASRTLLYYLSETNQHVYHWLIVYIRENPIPRVRLAYCAITPHESGPGMQKAPSDMILAHAFLHML